jgi:phosphate transport system protein
MSRYEERLAADKTAIRERVAAIGERVEKAIADAVQTLIARDRPAAYRIVLGDLPINREVRAIDRLCHAFVARHLPSAGHLRFVSSVLQMNVALERIGDYAVTIAREAVQLTDDPPAEIAAELSALSTEVCGILRKAMKAFANQDADLARTAKPLARKVDRSYGHMLHDLINKGVGRPLADTYALLTVFSKLERVSDQAKNICEETLFELTGETKPPKRYRILFVDEDCTTLAPLAEALARKAFPQSGHYDCAGFAAGDGLSPELSALADEIGLDLSSVRPAALQTSREALEDYHVIVCLTPEAETHIPVVPYATVLLRWDLPPVSAKSGLVSVGHQLADEIQALMVTMRGSEAD